MGKTKLVLATACLLALGSQGTSTAITINDTYAGLTTAQQDVIGGAINHWTTMVGQHEIDIRFIEDSSAGVAHATNWAWDSTTGRPTSADIHINTGSMNWTTDAPVSGQIDAMYVMMHEINHAIGWTVNGANFAANTETVGGNRFYDLNHNNSFDAATDFDLVDSASLGTHALNGTGDLMMPNAVTGTRLTPTYEHAGVLTDAYDYGVLLDGLGGDNGFGARAMSVNDDGSSSQLDLPFNINFFGNEYDSFFINNNGNITFESRLGSFTPTAFPVSNQPMIAPYWGDVDTRGIGDVWVASPSDDVVVVTWDDVGYYGSHTDLTNSFQVVLRNRDDIEDGDFDIEFRYDQLQWTTGDASGGSNGLGGTPAQAGYDAGDSTNYLTLPGSRTADVLNLTNTTNTPSNVDIDGLWVYSVRNGATPGSTADNPLMPVVIDDEWQFDFNIVDQNDPIFIDPVIAIGYDYYVDFGPDIASVLLPILGDNQYDLWLWDDTSSDFYDSGLDLTGGIWHAFATSLSSFRIMGIETALALDPTDSTAFITGLLFTGRGSITMRQVAVTFDTDAAAPVPEPGTMLLVGAGVLCLASRSRRKATNKR